MKVHWNNCRYLFWIESCGFMILKPILIVKQLIWWWITTFLHEQFWRLKPSQSSRPFWVWSYLFRPQVRVCVCVFAPGSTAFWSAALVNEFADRKQAGERLRAQRQKETFSRSHEVTFTATANMLTAAFSPCTSRSGPIAEVRENKHQERKQRLSEEQKHWVFHRESLFGTGHYPTIKLYQPK